MMDTKIYELISLRLKSIIKNKLYMVISSIVVLMSQSTKISQKWIKVWFSNMINLFFYIVIEDKYNLYKYSIICHISRLFFHSDTTLQTFKFFQNT